ncbi:MAG: hypothetical protein R2747_13565 [Pyrinomonadaceae bacterium]
MPNGKCNKHGGKTPKGFASPNFKHGKNSKYAYLPSNFSAQLENLLGDFIDNLEQSIEIQKLLETRLLEKLSTEESTEAWIKLKKAVSDYNDATHDPDPANRAAGQSKAFGMIKFIVDEGLNQSFLFRDIQSVHESQRKLSETLSKVRKEAQEIYTQEQWNEMLTVFAQILKTNITDSQTLKNIQDDLYERSNFYRQNSDGGRGH